MSSNRLVRVENLSKVYKIFSKPQDRLKQSIVRKKQLYREFWALQDVSLEVYKGETVGIIGRNGSGKSTLLQIIAGTLQQSSGRVEVLGRVAALLELGSGFNPEFTGRENVYMNGALLGATRGQVAELFDQIVDFSGIGDFIDQPVKTYSSGMMVRLAFAVQATISKDILIVDEALAVGDEMFQRKCYSKIEEFKFHGGTILFVSHSGSTVVELCDRAMMLDGGRALITGKSKDVVNLYQKFLHAPEHKKQAMREEIMAYGSRSVTLIPVDRNAEIPSSNVRHNAEIINSKVEAMFDPTLVSNSPLRYEARGAVIKAAEIVTLNGKRVNVLISGGTYIWRYQVEFKRSFDQVRFGMMLKTGTGLELGGAATDVSGLPHVDSGDVFRIEFTFCPKLNQGVYFLNAGVLAMEPEGEVYIDRGIDLGVFKILPREYSLMTGLVDFSALPQVFVGSIPGNTLTNESDSDTVSQSLIR